MSDKKKQPEPLKIEIDLNGYSFHAFHKDLLENDLEFANMHHLFAFTEADKAATAAHGERYLYLLGAIIGAHGVDDFMPMLVTGLNVGLFPQQVKEVCYTAVPLVGFSRVYTYLKLANAAFEKEHIKLPKKPLATVPPHPNLREHAGRVMLEELLGEVPEHLKRGKTFDRWFKRHVFGDYFTRKGMPFPIRLKVAISVLIGMQAPEEDIAFFMVLAQKAEVSRGELEELILQLATVLGFIKTKRALKILADTLD